VVGLRTAKSKSVSQQEMVHAKKNGMLAEIGRHKVLYLMILPTIVYFLIFNYLPMAGVYLAFTDFNF